jgi:hypothetical protein
MTDSFNSSKATHNFKFSTRNDHLKFDSFEFNYSSLDKDRRIEVGSGNGKLTVTNSKISFCRTGSSCARSLFFHSGNNGNYSNSCQLSQTIFSDNIYSGEVYGSKTFILHHIVGTSPNYFQNNHISISNSDFFTYVFGALTDKVNIRLVTHANVFIGSGRNVSLMANLWPPLLEGQPISHTSNHVRYMKAFSYGNNPDCDGWEELPQERCWTVDSSAPTMYPPPFSGYPYPYPYPNPPSNGNCNVPNPDTDVYDFHYNNNNHIGPDEGNIFYINYRTIKFPMNLTLMNSLIETPRKNRDPAILVERTDESTVNNISIFTTSSSFRRGKASFLGDPSWFSFDTSRIFGAVNWDDVVRRPGYEPGPAQTLFSTLPALP